MIRLPAIAFLALIAFNACGSDDEASSQNPSDAKQSVDEQPPAETTPSAPTSSDPDPAPIDPAALWDTRLAYGYMAAAPATGIARGKQVYEQWCIICHDDGVGMAGTASLARRYEGLEIPALLTERTDLYPEVTKMFVRNGIKSMPYFRKTEISDEDLENLAAYLSPDNPKK